MAGLFTADALGRVVQEQLATLPAGHRNAIIGSVDASGVQIVAGVALDAQAHWMVQGVFHHDWSGDTTGAAKVIVSW